MVAVVLKFTERGQIKTLPVSEHFRAPVEDVIIKPIPQQVPTHLKAIVDKARKNDIPIEMGEATCRGNTIRFVTCKV